MKLPAELASALPSLETSPGWEGVAEKRTGCQEGGV